MASDTIHLQQGKVLVQVQSYYQYLSVVNGFIVDDFKSEVSVAVVQVRVDAQDIKTLIKNTSCLHTGQFSWYSTELDIGVF